MQLDQSALAQINEWFAAADELHKSAGRLVGLKTAQANLPAVLAVTNVLTAADLLKLAARVTSATKTCEQFHTAMTLHGKEQHEKGREVERSRKGA